MATRCWIGVGICLALVAIPSRAASLPDRPRFAIERVGERQDLAAKTTVAFHQDRSGLIWLGTLDGVYRLEGGGHRAFGADDGLPTGAITVQGFADSADGDVVVALRQGLYLWNGDRFERLALDLPADGAINGVSGAIARDGEGRLWVATTVGLFRLRPRASAPPERLDPAPIRAVHAAPSGTIWAAAETGLLRFDAGASVGAHVEPDGLAGEPVRALATDQAGRLWLRTFRRLGWLELANQRFHPADTGLPGAIDLTTFGFDRSGRLLVATAVGLHIGGEDGWEAFDRRRGLASDAVVSAFEDSEGALWLGYGGAGFDRWPGRGTWSAWSEAEGLPNDVVWCVMRDARGRLWVGTNDGIGMWDGAAWRRIREIDGLTGRTFRHLAETADGAVWALPIPGRALTRFDPNSLAPQAVAFPPLAKGLLPTEIGSSAEGELWVASRAGILTLDGPPSAGRYRRVPGLDDVQSAAATVDGVVWSAGREGVVRDSRRFTENDGLRSRAVMQIAARHGDQAWIIYREAPGASRLRYEQGQLVVEHFGADRGLPSDNVFFVGLDVHDRAWLGTDAGVARVDTDGSVRRFEHSDGLVWNDTSADGFWAETDGSVFIGTSRGLAHYRPPASEAPSNPPAVVLTGFWLGDTPRLATVETPQVSWSERRLVTRFTAATYRRPDAVRFRHRLVGLEGDWNETAIGEARYPALPDGSYVFEVAARADGAAWGPAARREFSIRPPWWRSPPLLVAWSLLAASLLYGLYRWRVARLVRARNELEALVAARTQALHERAVELGEANRRLSDAQQRIVELQGQALSDPADLPRWTARMAREIAAAVGVAEIGVFRCHEGEVSPLATVTFSPPSAAEVERARGEVLEEEGSDGGSTLVPVPGPSGEVRAVLRVPGRLSTWGETERQLLSSFALHLGTTLDMERLRERVRGAEVRRAETLREMQEQGIDTLQECTRCAACFDQRASGCEFCGAPALSTAELLPYRIGARYRLIRRLGQGGMGIVFRAQDEKLDRPVAVKLIRAAQLADAAMRVRLERETHILARLRHPGLVALFDSGELADGSAFLVMELLEGVDFAEVIRREGPGSGPQVATVLRQVGEALSSAHALGVVHRDLKPANLFLGARPPAATSSAVFDPQRDFQVKLVDFGLARPMAADATVTATGIVVGSPAYMSPEQIRDTSLDAKSDLFSLASVAFELLTGRQAFDSPNIPDLFTRILREDPESLRVALPNVPKRIELAFAKAFQKRPEDRPALGEWIEETALLLDGFAGGAAGWQIAALLGGRAGSAAPAESHQPTREIRN